MRYARAVAITGTLANWLGVALGRGRRRRSAVMASAGPGVEYVWTGTPEPVSAPLVTGYWLGHEAMGDALSIWSARQSLRELVVVPGQSEGARRSAHETEPGPDPESSAWFFVLEDLPSWPVTLVEQAWLIAACEEVDRVTLAPAVATGAGGSALTLYRRAAWRLNRGLATVAAIDETWLGKELPLSETEDPVARRGEYVAADPRPGPWKVGLREPTARAVAPREHAVPRVLVTVPFLARGGAEQTLLETTRHMARGGEFEFAFATLAPHRMELGDRRAEFLEVSPLLYSLGDLLHPGALYGALLSLIDSLGVDLWYNANGTTLFYEFAERLRVDRPQVAIVDHLYDHRVGYIDWYVPERSASIDICVAENHPIATAVVERMAWPAERAPVIWPCGRARDESAARGLDPAERRRLREQLGLGADDLLVLTAARVHRQKRPLDWVALAERLADTPCHFVWVGGGPLEQELDRAIERASTRRLGRLPFRDDIPRLLEAADLACLVSEFEGLPVFLLEAIQAGCPFFGTDVGDVGRVLRESGAGVVAGAPGDLDALARTTRDLLDPDRRAECLRFARSSAHLFGVPATSGRYAEVFRRAIDERYRRRC